MQFSSYKGRPHLFFRHLTQPSLTTENQIQVSSEEELDKLYKTVELELRGNDPAVLKSFAKFATTTGQHLDIECKS